MTTQEIVVSGTGRYSILNPRTYVVLPSGIAARQIMLLGGEGGGTSCTPLNGVSVHKATELKKFHASRDIALLCGNK